MIDRYAEGGPLLVQATSRASRPSRPRDRPDPRDLEHRRAGRPPARLRPRLRRPDEADHRRGLADAPGLRRGRLDRPARLQRHARRRGRRPLRRQPPVDGPDPAGPGRGRLRPGRHAHRGGPRRRWPRSWSTRPTTSTTTSGSSTPSGPSSAWRSIPGTRPTPASDRSRRPDDGTTVRRDALGPAADLRPLRQARSRNAPARRRSSSRSGSPPETQTARLRLEKRPKGKVVTAVVGPRPRGQRPRRPRRQAQGPVRDRRDRQGRRRSSCKGDHLAAAEAALKAIGYKVRRG